MDENDGSLLEKYEIWLNDWYCKCRNKYIDLGNFGGNELFVIEGDSLLFKFLYDPETDLIDFSLSFSGGQFLALAFLVENFLIKLKERDFDFHIVFFDVHQSIWNNEPKLRLAREIIIDHLKSHATKVPVFEFENWWAEEWKEYLDNRQPLFILTGDGSTESLEIKESKQYADDAENSESSIFGIATKNSLSLTIMLRAFIFSSLHKDMPVALLPGMEFRDSRVYSFVFERSGSVDIETMKKLVDAKEFSIKALELYDEKSEWLKDSVKDFKLTTTIKDLLISEECLNVWSSGGKRIAITLLSLTGVLCNNDKPDFQYLARIFLLHTILLDYLPLKLRAVAPVVEESTKPKRRIELFFQEFYSYCAKIYISDILLETTRDLKDLNNNLYDLLDARLFVSLTQCRCDGVLNFEGLPIEIKQQFDAYWNLLKQLCECNGVNSLDVENDEKFGKKFIVQSYQKNYLENKEQQNLLPFNHDFFEECLGDISLNLPENPGVTIDEGHYGLIGNVYYNESTHNNPLKMSKDTNRVRTYNDKHKNSFERRGYQQFVRFLEKYAASLHGTQGYYRQKIVTDKSVKKEPSKSPSKSASKPVKTEATGSKKESTGTKKARGKIEQENLKKSLGESERYLNDALKEILKEGNIRNQINSLNMKLEKTERVKHPFTRFRGNFKKLELLMKLWTENCMNSKEKDWEIPVEILHQVFYIAQNFPKLLDNKRKEILVEILSRLKLNSCKSRLKKMCSSEKSDKNEKPPDFKFDLPSKWTDLSVGKSDARFQMLHAGHLMDRNTNSVEDERVPFRPDDWQVKVLDAIDNDESALICCPTSSGKTFISFYAMEKVLRESDDGLLVYVSPTKALVNQVTAEVYGRFEKTYDYGDKTTWGIYTREYSENQDKCQILVTIPQMLESLLFSPERASWARNIKRIIFDEVHMIGSEGGEFYDRLLLLSKSIPILALSATVGNPETFNEWIAKSKEIRGHKMELIRTTKRFSDLQPYVYLPKFPLPSLLDTTVNPKEKQQHNHSVVPINPIFSLSMGILKEYGLPDDMKLVPSQCVQLWDIMKKHAGEDPPDGLDELDPDVYFKNVGYIVKDDADEYEQKLKKIFISLARDDSLDKIIESTIEELGADIKNGFAQLESTAKELANNKLGEDEGEDESGKDESGKDEEDKDEAGKAEVGKDEVGKDEDELSNEEVDDELDAELGNGELANELNNKSIKSDDKLAKELDVYGNEYLKEGIVPLLCELSAQDKLPAILFHFDEKGCIELASHILKQLESAEDKKRAEDPAYKAKKKAAMLRKDAYEKDSKRKRDKKVNTQDLEPGFEESPSFFDWDAHDPDFTFVNPKARVTSDEFEELVGPLRYKMSGNSKILVAALERGIGVHHTDLPRKYLSAVEILFRRRYLRVIIATGTLALGINMPCKTTVFVGDSISLTALQYRQMSGRSGRRGFDPLGHVVFFGITLTKIVRLLMSGLPDLSRHFPLTTTLTLRSFNLLNQCKNNYNDYEFAKNAVKGLLGESFFFLGKEYLPERIKYHLRFSVEYLMRESLLGRKGNLINLSAMVTHLNSNEPSNFAFAVLYKHGVFHKICSRLRTNEEIMNDLVLILCRLFNRIKLRRISEDMYNNDETHSKVILPPLSEDIDDILEQHNERVLQLYSDYVVTFARNNATKLGLDNILPLSKIEIPPKDLDQTLLKEDPLLSRLESMAISFIARSPFIAMCSSLGDIFNDLGDLASHVRSEIYLDLHSIPFIQTNEPLNAYISDFFSHGQEEAVIKANGIRPGEVWKVLNDFYLVLSSIIISIKNKNFAMIEDNLDESDVLRGFEMVLEHFWEKFIQTWV